MAWTLRHLQGGVGSWGQQLWRATSREKATLYFKHKVRAKVGEIILIHNWTSFCYTFWQIAAILGHLFWVLAMTNNQRKKIKISNNKKCFSPMPVVKSLQYCFVLYCIALHCTVLHCIQSLKIWEMTFGNILENCTLPYSWPRNHYSFEINARTLIYPWHPFVCVSTTDWKSPLLNSSACFNPRIYFLKIHSNKPFWVVLLILISINNYHFYIALSCIEISLCQSCKS